MASLDSIGGIHYEMMRRCYNEKSVAYKDYGAKGITVCPEWHDRENFRKWAKENGYVKGMRLERVDGKGNYEPSNCVFGESLKKKSGIAKKTREIKEHRKSMKEFAGIDGNYCKTRLHNIYNGMHTRCENPNDMHYKNYGARGITVCEEWSGKDGFFHFYKWAMENGYADSLSIDRKDNNGNYCHENCRWSTPKEQTDNRRISKIFDYKGRNIGIADIAKMCNVTYGMVYARIVSKNMSVGECIEDLSNKSR